MSRSITSMKPAFGRNGVVTWALDASAGASKAKRLTAGRKRTFRLDRQTPGLDRVGAIQPSEGV
jgi:hypothetical protein